MNKETRTKERVENAKIRLLQVSCISLSIMMLIAMFIDLLNVLQFHFNLIGM